jgi:hypothetical protein
MVIFFLLLSVVELIPLGEVNLGYVSKPLLILWIFFLVLKKTELIPDHLVIQKNAIDIFKLLGILLLVDAARFDVPGAIDTLRWTTLPVVLTIYAHRTQPLDFDALLPASVATLFGAIVVWLFFNGTLVPATDIGDVATIFEHGELNLRGFFFPSPHHASATIASLQLALYCWLVFATRELSTYKKFYGWCLFWILMVVNVATGVRLGIACLVASIVASRGINKRLLLQGGVLVGCAYFFLNHFAPAYIDRLLDQGSIGDSDSRDAFQRIGSGRPFIWITYVAILSKNSIAQWLFGNGLTGMLNRMETEIGWRVLPHNGILYIVTAYGAAGTFVYARIFTHLKSIFKTTAIRRATAMYIAINVMFQFLAISYITAICIVFLLEADRRYAASELEREEPGEDSERPDLICAR